MGRGRYRGVQQAFPFGDHDDYVDSTTQALMRYRQGNFVKLPDDYYDEPRDTEQREYPTNAKNGPSPLVKEAIGGRIHSTRI